MGSCTSARQRPSPTIVAAPCASAEVLATAAAECDQIHSRPGFRPPVQKSKPGTWRDLCSRFKNKLILLESAECCDMRHCTKIVLCILLNISSIDHSEQNRRYCHCLFAFGLSSLDKTNIFGCSESRFWEIQRNSLCRLPESSRRSKLHNAP